MHFKVDAVCQMELHILDGKKGGEVGEGNVRVSCGGMEKGKIRERSADKELSE